MTILRGNDVTIDWAITRCVDGSEVNEDFSKAELTVRLVTVYDKKPASFRVEGNTIHLSVPGNTQRVGGLSIEAVWSKNDGKNWSRAKESDVIRFTDDPRKVDHHVCEADVKVNCVPVRTQLAGGIGYDGITPHIGANGHWFIGDTDTEVMADVGSRINVVSELPEIGIPGEFYAVFE